MNSSNKISQLFNIYSGILFLAVIAGGVKPALAGHATQVFSISTFTAPYNFHGVKAVAHDSSGNIYVGDVYSQTVQKFNADGVYLSAFRVDNFNQSYVDGLSVAPNGDIWLSGSGGWPPAIGRFSPGGVLISSFPAPNPTRSIFVDSSTYIYATIGHEMKKFSAAGATLLTIGSEGTGDGQFDFPTDVSVDTTGFI